jgi:predicted ATPase
MKIMNDIKIVKHVSQQVKLFNSSDSLIGVLKNEYELNSVRIQIAEQNTSGYYITWKEHKLLISNAGKLSEWPVGLYDEQEIALAQLFRIQRERSY